MMTLGNHHTQYVLVYLWKCTTQLLRIWELLTSHFYDESVVDSEQV